MKPTEKSSAINKQLNKLSGDDREQAIIEGRCIKPPIGCGGPARIFHSEASLKEHRISGLCEKCQSKIFGDP
jgi:hypothetical protein